MESAESKPRSLETSPLCEEVKPETWTTSDGGTSGSLGLVTSGLLEKSIKEEEIKDEDDLCGGTSSSLEPFTPVEQQNGEILKKPVKEEEPEDENLYCEECRSFFINKCEVHGPALFIPDSPVPMEVTDRARQTLPPGLEIGDSGVSAAALGVFNKGETLPVGAHFGPYQGDLVDKEEAMDSPYSWVISKNGQCEEFIDARRKTHSNWMRYVNCAGNDKEQNLVVFQYRGGIHYRCCRPIQSGQELLLWYKGEHAKDVGITFTHLWNKRSSSNNMDVAPSEGFSCSLCQVCYSSQIYLHKHIKRCHHVEYMRMLRSGEIRYEDLLHTNCKSLESSGSVTVSSSSTAEKEEIYHCSKCEKNFSRHSYFITHRCIRSVTLYHCSQCEKSFNHRNSLRSHQLVHTGEKPYRCSQCEKSFTCKSSLKSHQVFHTAEKRYQCSQCAKCFTHWSLFQAHRRTHTGEKPHHCSQCERGFTSLSHLEQHQIIHSGEKRYHCSHCGKNFAHEKSLKGHQCSRGVKKSYRCSECGKSFNKMGNLKRHQRTHTRAKTFHLSECGKSFSGGTSSSLEPFTPVEQQNGEILKKPVKEEEPEDENLYCEECRSFFVNKCEVHGPALFIPDSPVPMGVTDRARQTLPPGLEIGDSGVSAAALGVFNKGETLPVGAHFGPYQGDLVDKEEAMDSPYSWVIYKSRQCEEYIDAKRESHSNWMRYVNCAGNDKEQNLVVFQYRGGIHYRCCRPIQSGQELLLWYKGEHAKDVGITFTHLWNKRSSSNKNKSGSSEGFSCSLCQVCYSSQIYLHKHIKRCHHVEYMRMLRSGEIRYEDLLHTNCKSLESSGSVTVSSSSTAEKEEIYHCSKCEKNFSQHSYFITHRCIRSVTLYHCSQCGKSFNHRNSLRSHQLVHTGEKPYRCSQCEKSFTCKSSLKSHQVFHTAEKRYQCSQCAKCFTHWSLFQAHRRTHTGEKPHHCSQCERGFTSLSHLEQHQIIHSGEKRYHCSECGKSFSKRYHLKQHKRIHSGEKPYYCAECGKSFTHKIQLKRHQRFHPEAKP